LTKAIGHLQKAIELDSGNVVAENNLGNALLQMGRVDEAVSHLQKVMSAAS